MCRQAEDEEGWMAGSQCQALAQTLSLMLMLFLEVGGLTLLWRQTEVKGPPTRWSSWGWVKFQVMCSRPPLGFLQKKVWLLWVAKITDLLQTLACKRIFRPQSWLCMSEDHLSSDLQKRFPVLLQDARLPKHGSQTPPGQAFAGGTVSISKLQEMNKKLVEENQRLQTKMLRLDAPSTVDPDLQEKYNKLIEVVYLHNHPLHLIHSGIPWLVLPCWL